MGITTWSQNLYIRYYSRVAQGASEKTVVLCERCSVPHGEVVELFRQEALDEDEGIDGPVLACLLLITAG